MNGGLDDPVVAAEVAIVQRLAVQFDGGASDRAERIAVPAKRLLDTIRALPELPVEFASDEEHQIVLTTDQGRYQMIGHDGGDSLDKVVFF